MATGSSNSSSSDGGGDRRDRDRGGGGGDGASSGGGGDGGGHGHHHHHHHHHHQQQHHHHHYQQPLKPDGQVAGTTMMMEEAEVEAAAAAASSPMQHGMTDSSSLSSAAAALSRGGSSSSSSAVAATTTSLINNSSSIITTTTTATTTTIPTLPVTHGLSQPLPPPSPTAVAAAAAALPLSHPSPPTVPLPSLVSTPSSPSASRTLLPPSLSQASSSSLSSSSTTATSSSSRVTIAAPSGTTTSSRIELTTASSLSLAKRKKEMDSSRDGSGLHYKRLKYDWNQTDDHVTITVKLGDEAEFSDPEFSQTGVKMKLRDGTVWGLTFNSEIDSNNCKMELADSSTSMVLTVRKKVHSHWTSLEADIGDDHNQAVGLMDSDMTAANVPEQLVSNENDDSWNDPGTEMYPLDSCYQLQHTKHDWIEKNETFIIHIYVRKTNLDGVKVFFKQRLVTVLFQTSDPKFLDLHQGTTESTVFCWKINVKNEILPLACKYRVTGSLIEVTLSKKEPLKWGALEVPLQKRNIMGNRSTEWLSATKDRPVPLVQQTCSSNGAAAAVVSTATGTTFSSSSNTMSTGSYSSSSSSTVTTTGYPPPPPPPPPPAPPLPALPTAVAAAMSSASHYSTSSTAQRGGSGDGMPLDELQELAATPGTIGDRRGVPTCDNFSPSNPCSKPTLPMVNQKPTCKVSPMNKLRDVDQLVTPGFTGLDNLGNSCFMNSVLQCLANTSEFRDYFLDGSFQKEINTENLLGSGGQLASAFAVLLRCLWSGKYTSYQPSKLKNLVAMKASVFTGFAQHDAQEFMAFLLDMLHEDLNRVKNKPYIQTVDSDGRPDEIVANEAWDVYKKRDDSFIVDLFQGQYKSKLVCPVCEKVSITFDPFCYLSIPLPKKQRLITVVFFWKEPYRKPVQYKLRLPKDATVELLKDKLSKKTSVKSRNIRVFESKRSKIHKIYGRGTLLSSDYSTERLIASEVLSQEMAGEPVYEIYIIQRVRMPMFSSTMCSSCKKKSPEGRPLKRCTRCYKVGYCNQECQRAHWEIHKESCKCNPIGCPFLISLPKSRATFSRLRKLLEAYSRYSVNVFQPPVKAEVSSSTSATAAVASMAAAAAETTTTILSSTSISTSTTAAATTATAATTTTTTTKLPSSITAGCSMSGLSSSSQSSGSLSSLDSQASYSSACTLTADPETNMADVRDDDDNNHHDGDGGDDGRVDDAITSMTTTTASGFCRDEAEEEEDEEDICSGGGDGRRKRSNTTGSVMSSDQLRAGLPACFSPIPTLPSNSSVAPPLTSLGKCTPLPTAPTSLSMATTTAANSTPPLPPPPPPLPPAAVSPTMPALTPSGDPSPLPLMPFSRTEEDTMLDVEQWQRASLLSSSSSSPSLPSTSPPAPCLPSSSSAATSSTTSPAHQSPATTPTAATSAGGGDASLLLSDRMHLGRTQLPTSAVLGLQNEETPLDQGPALFFVKPVCQDGSEINSYNGIKLEDRGDEVLDLKNKKFMAMDWQNNDRQPRFVLVQSKELECDDDETVQLESLDDTSDISLDHCLNLFTEPEVLSQEEAWYCPQCAEHREATKQMSIWRLPRMLIIQLKRFSYGHLSWRDKVDKMVDFPTRGLDMSRYFIGNRPDCQTSTIYDLYGVINHTGGLLGGHYTAYVRCADKFTPYKNEVDWRFCDDSHVVPVVEKNVVTQLAYLLFYRRHDAPAMSESELTGIMSDAVSSTAGGVIGGYPLSKTNATSSMTTLSTALMTANNSKTVPEGQCSAGKTEEMPPELQLSADVSERKLAVGNAALNWGHSATSDVIVDDDTFPPPLDNRYSCTSLPYTDMDAVD